MNPDNRKAFLDVIAHSEGTKGVGDDGYNVVVGGTLFHDYSQHPNQRVWIPRLGVYSTAAGKYQLLYRYWIVYMETLSLHLFKSGAFGPEAQDKVALQQIAETHALDDVDRGDFDIAINKCSRIWASLPGGSQHSQDNTLLKLRNSFAMYGGNLNVV